MSIKSQVLAIIEKDRGTPISGEEIAGILGVSRTAVWKAVKALKQEGYVIEAVPNRGYSLLEINNILSKEGLSPYLDNPMWGDKIHIYPNLPSTNETAKTLALDGCPHGTAVIADGQTQGKGRRGKNFYSPAGSGLYLSIVLREEWLLSLSAPLITAGVAVQVCAAVEEVAGVAPQIKWVNDIMLDGKKIGGILTEAVIDFEEGGLDWVVSGVGINISTDSFPPELSGKAASILPGKADNNMRARLAASIINGVMLESFWRNPSRILEEYKCRLAILGKTITVRENGDSYRALALDIDSAGCLVVQKNDGAVVTLSSPQAAIHI